MKRLRVYIASPYSKPDPCINTREAIDAANHLLGGGLIPFVPHLAHFWHTVTPKPYEEWLAYDDAWIDVCDAMLRLPGESSGADRETAKAKALGIPVFETFKDLFAWQKAALAREKTA